MQNRDYLQKHQYRGGCMGDSADHLHSGTPATVPAVADTAAAPDQSWSVAWHRGLKFRALAAGILLTAWIVAGIVIVMNREGKTHLEREAYRLIEQMGNTVVTGLDARLDEVSALTRSVATASQVLPKDEARFMADLPRLIDFGGDRGVAGGGFWPEPFRFTPDRERRSFFWGRDDKDQLNYFDDYNQPGPGYHNEEWYVPARFVRNDTCYWSQSYTDPYSFQPMVTCTVPVREGEALTGVTTIDMRLEGLANFAREWAQRTGGYIFLVDRYNRFITYADPTKVKRIGKNDKGDRTEEFILAAEYAKAEPGFAEAERALAAMNDELLALARKNAGDKIDAVAKQIDEASYQIDASQALLTAAVLTDPLKNQLTLDKGTLYRTTPLSTDPVLKQPSTLFLFHVPGPYWKLGVVKPVAETVAVADSITRLLIGYLLATILFAIVLAYWIFSRWMLGPIAKISGAVRRMGQLISERRHHELDDSRLEVKSRNEIGLLGAHINTLAHEIVTSEGKLAEANAMLERRVQERTEELSRTLTQLKNSQAQLVQSEKMASLGQMVAGIAHEINTPLGYVKNNILMGKELQQRFLELAEIAEKQAGSPAAVTADANVAKTIACAQEIRKDQVAEDTTQLATDALYGVEQISELVLNLRNFSRLDEAKVKDVSIHECIDSALNIARNQLKAKVEVIKDYADVPTISCSPSQINQIFINLFNNAAQAIETTGKILIKTSYSDGYVHIAVQDNGKGIPKEIISRIFEPFFTTKPVGHGTGLGLSITYQIVQQHNGHIRVASEPGRGTRFVISLPTQQRAQVAA
ncbi:sensor histidine kinase [Tahibacter amnicola]|uniref:histidine kinase n=1 Tax=Tahibacter amnicola TaxID=2976241 RepID=A0ABY6BDP8_9GAMM|nr:ATP-binding protein [Tahibacter amnicola]UXI68149.1 ATP-binding protein [Tahibacter amnicola]